MSIFGTIILSFVIICFTVLGIAFWAALYPRALCQKVCPGEEDWNVCVKRKGHPGDHMAVSGKRFILIDDD